MAQFRTDFRDDVVGQLPAGWDRPTWGASGPPYAVRDDATAPSGKAVHGLSGSGDKCILWVEAGSTNTSEMLALVRAASTTSNRAAGIVLRATSTGTRYTVELMIRDHNTLRLGKLYPGFTQLGAAPFSYVSGREGGDWVWLRAQAIGTTFRGKAWKDGDPEPEDWMVSVSSGSVPGSGYVGLYTYASEGATDCAFFSVGTDGDPAPPPADPPATPSVAVDSITQDAARLVGSEYSDPAGHAHAATEAVVRSADADEIVYESGELAPVTVVEIPPGTLSPDTEYVARLRYKNAVGLWGEWSDPIRFATLAEQPEGGWVPCPPPPATSWQACPPPGDHVEVEPGIRSRFWRWQTLEQAMVIDEQAEPSEEVVLDTINLTNRYGELAQNWNARFDGFLRPAYSEEYTFYVTSNDGVRIWLDGELVYEDWTVHDNTSVAVNVGHLRADRYIPLRIDFFQGPPRSRLLIEWASLSQPRGVIDSFFHEAIAPGWEPCGIPPTTPWEAC